MFIEGGKSTYEILYTSTIYGQIGPDLRPEALKQGPEFQKFGRAFHGHLTHVDHVAPRQTKNNDNSD